MSSTQVPFPKLLGKADVQKLLDVSDRTLEKMVRARQFPPPLRLGKTVRWAETVIQEWLATRLEAQMSWQPPRRATRAVPGTVKS